jgi:hypothetical protein
MTVTNTIGTARVVCCNALVAALAEARMTSGASETSFFASAASVRSTASVDARVAAVGPAQLLQRLYERRVACLPFRIVRGQIHEYADATNPIGLLRPRREAACASFRCINRGGRRAPSIAT